MNVQPLDWQRVPLVGRQLIEASAGTGKTYTITTLVLRLILERQVRVDELLVVTFTNAATAELRDRIRSRLRSAVTAMEVGQSPDDPQIEALVRSSSDREGDRQRLQEALRSMDEAAIYTIHGFCQRVLQEHAFESGVRFDLELVTDSRPLLSELVQDFWARVTEGAAEACVRHLQTHLPVPSMQRLARLVAGAPGIRVEPEPRVCDPEPALERYLAERKALAARWETSRDEVTALLSSSPALSRTMYRTASVPGWIAQLEKLLESESASTRGMFEDFERFTAPRLRAATKKGCATPEHPFFTACGRLWDAHRALERDLADWTLRVAHDLIAFTCTELVDRKQRSGIQTFDDLLQQLAQALRGEGGRVLAKRIFERHPYGLIDEFQDTDPTQYDIFDRIYSDDANQPRGALLMIGDPKQAIYAFRGADVFAYLRAARDASGAIWTLDTSYRTDPTLLHALNQLFSRPERPFELEAIRYHPVQPRAGATDRLQWPVSRGSAVRDSAPFQLLFVRQDDSQQGRDPLVLKRMAAGVVHAAVAREIVVLLDSGATIDGRRVGPGDIAVLTRKNREALQLQEVLAGLGVPAVLHGDASVFDAPEAAELSRILRAMAAPAATAALRAALATKIIGLSANELDRLARDEVAWERWVEQFFTWHEIWVQRGFVQAFRSFLRKLALPPKLLAERGGERRLTNLMHLGELLHEAAATLHLGVAGLLRWLDQVRHDAAARDVLAPESQQVRLESDAHAVQLTTMHRSKGLEYPVVFCPFLWDGKLRFETMMVQYHDPAEQHRLTVDLAPGEQRPEARRLADQEALAEALRLAYVAMTRAKHRLVVVCGNLRSYGTSPLAHLLHDPGFLEKANERTPAERVKRAEVDELLADLEELIAVSRRPGMASAVTVSEPGTDPLRRYQPRGVGVQSLAHRRARRRLDSRWRATSFSALTSGAAEAEGPAAEGLDHDAAAIHSSTAGSSVEPGDFPGEFHTFPRGAGPGSALHGILEQLDFTTADTADWQSLCSDCLERFGINGGLHADAVVRGLQSVVETPLDASGLRLSRIPSSARISEMEFTLPVGRERAGAVESARRRTLTPRRLATVFSKYASPVVPRDYATRVANLGFDGLTGYLRGFIDLVFVHDRRWYVVDYKSNHLGPSLADYAPSRLTDAMADHHYFLQYHLYAAALHRHLLARQPGYDYADDFGGIFYLFLRGMSPRRGPAAGVFADRPDVAMIEALLDVLDGDGRSAT